MTIFAVDVRAAEARGPVPASAKRSRVRVGLLGLGVVGTAVARQALATADAPDVEIAVAGALVRNPGTRRGLPFPVTSEPFAILDTQPDVVVEVLGGLEPARTLVLEALSRGIPVVTANKSLVARHGDELFDAADRAGVPLRYEAAVIAGVPFLCAFAGRPFASRLRGVSAILNGTSNFILTEVERGAELSAAIDTARVRGFAEPDASKDLNGTDAAEKLAILARHFGGISVLAEDIDRTGIETLTRADLECAAAFGGRIRPLAVADWTDGPLSAWVTPAFVPDGHPLATVRGVTNGICLQPREGAPLVFTGPGAGPDVTATTVLDDVLDACTAGRTSHRRALPASFEGERETGWFVRLSHPAGAPAGRDVADLLSAFDVWPHRIAGSEIGGGTTRWLLTYPCGRNRVERALDALRASSGCDTHAIRAVEARS